MDLTRIFVVVRS